LLFGLWAFRTRGAVCGRSKIRTWDLVIISDAL
jgi:hypothetical protein